MDQTIETHIYTSNLEGSLNTSSVKRYFTGTLSVSLVGIPLLHRLIKAFLLHSFPNLVKLE